jgi:uncharacterized RDD family membrane protein YckC
MATRPILTMQQGEAGAAVVPADKWLRVAGYFVDLVPAVIFGLVALIPFIGLIFAGFLLTPYWLLRDITGASLGKLAVGMRVVGQNGQPAPKGALMLRNFPLIAAPLCMLIPFLNYFLVLPVGGIVVLVEGIMLLSQGSRLGDKMAGTVVVKK